MKIYPHHKYNIGYLHIRIVNHNTADCKFISTNIPIQLAAKQKTINTLLNVSNSIISMFPGYTITCFRILYKDGDNECLLKEQNKIYNSLIWSD